jgi:hypothetical protein
MKTKLHKLCDLSRCRLRARDGELGTLERIFFDDLDWIVRYFIVRIGSRLMGREILVPPSKVRRLAEEPSVLQVALTRKQLEDAPPADSQLPVSRHYELQAGRYVEPFPSPRRHTGPYEATPGAFCPFGWPPYAPQERLFDLTTPHSASPGRLGNPEKPRHPHLRCSEAVKGYALRARDGEIGHIADFILAEDPDWKVRYIEIDTRNWLPGKHVLLAPAWVRSLNWALRRVNVDLDRQTLRTAPAYDHDREISEDDEIALFEHYQPNVAEG